MKKKLIISLIIIYTLLFYFLNKGNAEEILATFNWQKITLSEFNLLCQVPIKYGVRHVLREEKENLLNTAIVASLVAPKIKKNISTSDDLIIKQKVKAFREYTLDLLRRKKIMQETIIDNNNYKNYLPIYGGKSVRFREIVVRSKPEAEGVLKGILNGKDFEALAKEKSINKNSIKGGDTGFIIIGKGAYPPEVEKAIFNLNIGDMSGILKTFEGYAIFKALEMRDLTDQEGKDLIQNLWRKLIIEKTDSLLEKSRSKANIKIFSDNIKRIQELSYLSDDSLHIELAKVDKNIIKLADVVNKVKSPINPLKSRSFLNISNMTETINNEINEILLDNEAVKIGLDKDPTFENAMRRFEDMCCMNTYINNVLLSNVTCSEPEIKNFYEKYKDTKHYQNLPELVRVRHILLDDDNLAKDILKQLKNGANFNEMVRKYSLFQPTREIDGDWGYLECGGLGQMLTKEEEEVLFMLSKGQLSEIMKAKPMSQGYGNTDQSFYNIFRLEDKISAGEKDYSKIKGLIKYDLLKKKRKKIEHDFLAPFIAKADIKKDLNAFNSSVKNSQAGE